METAPRARGKPQNDHQLRLYKNIRMFGSFPAVASPGLGYTKLFYPLSSQDALKKKGEGGQEELPDEKKKREKKNK